MLVIEQADEVIFLNLPVNICIENAKNRPLESYKYEHKEAQDANLAMLLGWISQYPVRTDTFSKVADEKLFADFQGNKVMYLISNQHDRLTGVETNCVYPQIFGDIAT